MRKLLLKILPKSVIEIYKNRKRQAKLNHRKQLEQNNQIITQGQIEEVLINIGIKSDDVIMLHSSLSKIGFVQNGAETIISAFLKVIGNNGTLVMPAFPAMGYNYDYLQLNPVFNVNSTPSKMGIVTEVFRKMNGVKRSLHPTDSVCALGQRAEFITDSHFNQLTPYNVNSPFYKLCTLNAKIILLGVDFNSLTNLHTLEDAVNNFKFPIYHSHVFECEIVNEKNEKLKVKTKCHDPKWSKQRKCNELISSFKNAGFLKETKLGEANLYVIEAKSMHEWMLKSYIDKGITMYTPQGS
jgi:aminoglycoside 3-N-acetyltransferase